MKQSIISIFILLLISLSGYSTAYAVTFSDTEFNTLLSKSDFRDWSTQVVMRGPDGTSGGSATQVDLGGHPGKYMQVSASRDPVTPGLDNSTGVWSFFNTVYDPMVSGAIVKIDMSIDTIQFGGGSGGGLNPALLQGGKRYLARFVGISMPETDWTPRSFSELMESDFRDPDDINSMPDFSSSGSPIYFGWVYVVSSATGNPVSRTVGFDNWSLTVNPSATLVDTGGTIKTIDGTDICAMVLASGKFMFSCNPIGRFLLTNLARETNGTVKRQIYADGFFPRIDILSDTSTDEEVILKRSGACPSYNISYDPAFVPGSAGKRVNIAGKVLLQDTQIPICAMVLANGQYMFTCDGTGEYGLNIPLDSKGQYKLQVYADGFAPTIQTFEEFKTINNVHMARALECQ